MTKQLGICEKCNSAMVVKTNKSNNQQFWACSAYPNCKNTRALEVPGAQVTTPVAQPQYAEEVVVQKIGAVPGIAPKSTEIKAPTGEYQSLVYNKTLSANSYEVGRAGERFKLYFETFEDLQAKLKELRDAGLLFDDVKEAFE